MLGLAPGSSFRAGGWPLTMPGKHQHFQEPEVGCCGKYFLFGFNIVFWVSAGSAPCPALRGGGRGRFSLLLGETTPCPKSLELGTIPPVLPPPRPLPGLPEVATEARIAGGGSQLLRGVGVGVGSLPE